MRKKVIVVFLTITLLFGNIPSTFASPISSSGWKKNNSVHSVRMTKTGTTKNYTAKTYSTYLGELEMKSKKISDKAYTTYDMNMAASAIYDMWDDELNFLYQKLKGKLSTGNFKKLQEEQRKWVTSKLKEMKKVEAEYKGGSIETLAVLTTASEMTRKRVYVLADKTYGKGYFFSKNRVDEKNYINGSDDAYAISFKTTKNGDIYFTLKTTDGKKVLNQSILTIIDHRTLGYKNTKTGWDINLKWNNNSDWIFKISGKIPGYKDIIGGEFEESNQLGSS